MVCDKLAAQKEALRLAAFGNLFDHSMPASEEMETQAHGFAMPSR
jgi:hypothetical protein